MPWVEATATLRGATVVLDDRVVLREVDLRAGPGITVVRGRNGAGKTTLLRALAGLVPLRSGTREVSGGLLYLGHRPQLHRALTATENLSFFARYRGLRSDGIGAALAAWGVVDADRPVERLSAGQRRRASLARMDVEGTGVLLLDEPFAELDDEGARILLERVEGSAARGRTLLIATHAHEELRSHPTLTVADGRLTR